MKKFLIFLVAIVVVVCLGATTYYFLRNDEVIKLAKYSLQINKEDSFSLRGKDYKGLGLTVTRKNRNTKYGYEVYQIVDGKKVKADDCIIYNSASDTYLAKKGGKYIFTITTTNKKYKEIDVNVTIGDGNEIPYFIRTAQELNKYLGEMEIDGTGAVNSNASLLNDVTLGADFVSLPKYDGYFNGNGYAINGLDLTGESANAGLFTELTGEVYNLTINTPKINGSFANAGALAGTISDDAVVSGVQVKQPTIVNTNDNGVTGGLAGTIKDDALIAVSYTDKANITVNSASAVATLAETSKTVGGLVGVNDKADIKASYAKAVTINATDATVGGLVGEFIVDKSYENSVTDSTFKNNGTIQQSYATGVSDAFIGKLTAENKIETKNSEPYSYLVGNYTDSNAGDNLVGVKDTTGAQDLVDAITNAASNNKPNTISTMPESGKPYMFYQDVQWQSNLWDLTSTPALKLDNGISADNVVSPGQGYFATVRNPAEPTDSNGLKNDLTNKSDSTISIQIKKNQDGYTLDEKFDFENRTLTGVDADGNPAVGDDRPVVKVSKELLNNMIHSTVSNIILEVTGVEATDGIFGAVANKVSAGSTISNVTVKFVNATGEALELELADTIVTFGGVAGELTNSTISGCDVEGLNIKSSKITSFGGIAAISTTSTIQVNNNKVEATINTSATTKAQIGGVAATSTKEISGAENINLAVNLNVASLTATADISAIVADNNGKVANIKLNGVVKYPATFNGDINVAGAAVNNNGEIANVYYEAGAIGEASNGETNNNHTVAGLAVINNGSIAQATVKANLNGANVSGIVNAMANGSTVDQVYVGGQLYGSKYVIGLCYSANFGSITNVQAESTLKGQLADTHVSALVYEFDRNGTVQRVIVNSVFDGNGVFHRDTQYIKAGDANNIYSPDMSQTGEMTNIVINIEKLISGNVKSYNQSKYIGNGNFLDFINGKITSNGTNFIREVTTEQFNNRDYFTGRFSVALNGGNTLNKPSNVDSRSYTLEFSIGNAEQPNVWMEATGAGIQLAFLDSIPADVVAD